MSSNKWSAKSQKFNKSISLSGKYKISTQTPMIKISELCPNNQSGVNKYRQSQEEDPPIKTTNLLLEITNLFNREQIMPGMLGRQDYLMVGGSVACYRFNIITYPMGPKTTFSITEITRTLSHKTLHPWNNQKPPNKRTPWFGIHHHLLDNQ